MAQATGRLENGSPWGAKTAGESKRWTRRDWLKASAMAGASAGAGTLVGLALYPTLFGTPAPPRTVARESLVYTNPANLDVWWKGLVNREVSVTDFQEWQGASALWQGIFQDATWVEGTGLPVLVIRVKRDTANFQAPSDVSVPSGFSLYYDDPGRDLRIVVVFDRSTYLCCYPGWHLVTNPPPLRDYIAYSPTYELYGQDPIYDICHGGQWDPMILEWGTNSRNNTAYVGARMVHGPGFGPLPVVSVRADGDLVVGGMIDPRWYQYC
ncbi:MAG: twin-arginine translocation signal domain-containing protein [Methanobacteriota archaeon]|nr:MAG: twin-arginine translocation signal domain-containing protein [Euryarchaeota archaeon]TLZ81928.1 MAG: twin-arginine translocation signal domain-containing protein [Euryarchaeota archaeon]